MVIMEFWAKNRQDIKKYDYGTRVVHGRFFMRKPTDGTESK